MLRYVKSRDGVYLYISKIVEDLMGREISKDTVQVSEVLDFKWDDPEILYNKYCHPLERTLQD